MKKISTVSKQNPVITFVFIVYLSLLFYELFVGNRTFDISWIKNGGFRALQIAMSDHINLIPFATINNYLNKYQLGRVSEWTMLVNLAGNLAAFAPMGYFLPKLSDTFKQRFYFYSTIILMLFSVETLQYLTMSGAFDVDDMILNLLGVIILFELFKGARWIIRKGRRKNHA